MVWRLSVPWRICGGFTFSLSRCGNIKCSRAADVKIMCPLGVDGEIDRFHEICAEIICFRGVDVDIDSSHGLSVELKCFRDVYVPIPNLVSKISMENCIGKVACRPF